MSLNVYFVRSVKKFMTNRNLSNICLNVKKSLNFTNKDKSSKEPYMRLTPKDLVYLKERPMEGKLSKDNL